MAFSSSSDIGTKADAGKDSQLASVWPCETLCFNAETTYEISGMPSNAMIRTLSQAHVVQYHLEYQDECLCTVFYSSHHPFVMLYVSRAPAQTLLSFVTPASADKDVGKARQRNDACEYACGNAAACEYFCKPQHSINRRGTPAAALKRNNNIQPR